MRIAPIPAPVAPDAQAPRAPSVHALKMNTRATPGVIDPVPEVPAEAPAEEKLSNSTNNESTEGTVESTRPLSPQIAALAKERRALQVKERELAEREKALEARSSTQEGAVDIARLKSEPLRVLLEAGVTYEQLTEALLADQDGSNAEVMSLKAKVDALEKGIDQKLSEKDVQAKKQALAEMEREAKRLMADGEAFELVRTTGNIPTVMQLIEKTFDQTGEILDVKAAMQLVEDELIADSLKLASLKKIQSKLHPEAPPAPQPAVQRPRTLTNRDTATMPLSAKQRALLAARGELKK